MGDGDLIMITPEAGAFVWRFCGTVVVSLLERRKLPFPEYTKITSRYSQSEDAIESICAKISNGHCEFEINGDVGVRVKMQYKSIQS